MPTPGPALLLLVPVTYLLCAFAPRRWTSSHAFNVRFDKVCRQACQQCGRLRYAWCLWQSAAPRGANEPKKFTGAHQAHNCQRCRAGLPCHETS